MNNLRAVWVSTEKVDYANRYRPLCAMYTAENGYCKERTTHMVTLRVSYDCCHENPCACGPYATFNFCLSHARRYGPIKGELNFL
jgi:hypothetical protein